MNPTIVPSPLDLALTNARRANDAKAVATHLTQQCALEAQDRQAREDWEAMMETLTRAGKIATFIAAVAGGIAWWLA